MRKEKQDLIIIGGGIMGLFTAYYASLFTNRIIILEKSTIGNKEASSFSYTRSMRNDYLDAYYSRFAYEAQSLWKQLQKASPKQFLYQAGCLNLAKRDITPELDKTYATQSYQVLNDLNLQAEKFSEQQLKKRFPQFVADLGCLDVQAGFLFLPVITTFLLQNAKQKGIAIYENIDITEIKESSELVTVTTDKGRLQAKNLVLTPGRWINDLLKIISKNSVLFPISLDKPQECKYVYPATKDIPLFKSNRFPVFAYLDVGIYGHPIFDARNAIKIGYYNPPDIEKKQNKKIQSIDDFIAECLPLLRGAKMEKVTDADQCSYDLVGDDNFILGKLPRFPRISVGAGWRGTGYKFAPLAGKILAQLSLQKETVYDITRFSPERFGTYEK